MKVFTIKDFLQYNAPCFSCGQKVVIQFAHHNDSASTYIKPTIINSLLELDLHVKWLKINQVNLIIDLQTNHIATSNKQGLIKFINDRKVYAESKCKDCGTIIRSDYLTFDFQSMLIKGVGLAFEQLVVFEKQVKYVLCSSINGYGGECSKSQMYAWNNLSAGTFDQVIPLCPLYKFRNRQHFLDKMKTICVFS